MVLVNSSGRRADGDTVTAGEDPAATSAELKRIARHRSGDPTAFEEIVEEHSAALFNIAFRLAGNREDAQDLYQEVLIKVYRSLGKFRAESSLRTWICRIAVNTAKNRARWWSRVKRGHALPLDDVEQNGRPASERVADPAPDPENMAYGREIDRRVQEGLDQLPWNQRTVVILRDIEGLDYREIAQVLEISLGTVKSRLARGREGLRRELSDLLESS